MSSHEHDPGLGSLAKLPPEIRLCIYDWISPIKYRALKRPGPRSPSREVLGILRASRKLHDEVSHQIYHGIALVFNLEPTVGGFWATACIPMLFDHRFTWYFRSPDSAIHKGFGNFPYHKVEVMVKVPAPDPNDSGQLVVLWRKLNQLVNILAKASSIKHITLILQPKEGRTWIKDGRGQMSLPLLDSEMAEWAGDLLRIGLERELYDHEVIFLPFCQLKNVNAMGIFLRWDLPPKGFRALDLSLLDALSHFTKKGRKRLPVKRREEADRVLNLIPHFIYELNRRYRWVSSEIDESSPTACLLLREMCVSKRWWEGDLQTNEEYQPMRYGDKTWKFPTFILDAGKGLSCFMQGRREQGKSSWTRLRLVGGKALLHDGKI